MSALLKWLNLTWASVNAKFREVVSSGAELEVSEKSPLVMLASKHVLCLCVALRRRPGGWGSRETACSGLMWELSSKTQGLNLGCSCESTKS